MDFVENGDQWSRKKRGENMEFMRGIRNRLFHCVLEYSQKYKGSISHQLTEFYTMLVKIFEWNNIRFIHLVIIEIQGLFKGMS